MVIHRWKCTKCSKVTSVRNDSLFPGSHLSLQQMVGQRAMLKKILLVKRNWDNTRRIQKLTGVLFVKIYASNI
jgi:hypothetical protein